MVACDCMQWLHVFTCYEKMSFMLLCPLHVFICYDCMYMYAMRKKMPYIDLSNPKKAMYKVRFFSKKGLHGFIRLWSRVFQNTRIKYNFIQIWLSAKNFCTLYLVLRYTLTFAKKGLIFHVLADYSPNTIIIKKFTNTKLMKTLTFTAGMKTLTSIKGYFSVCS